MRVGVGFGVKRVRGEGEVGVGGVVISESERSVKAKRMMGLRGRAVGARGSGGGS